MSIGHRVRPSFFEIGLLLLLIVVSWVAVRAYYVAREVDRIPVTFGGMQVGYFQIADHIQPSIDELNVILRRFALRTETEQWRQFLRKSQEPRAWLELR